MRIRPTELGLKGILLLSALVVAFLAASYSNLFFLIIAFCSVLGTLGLWWSVRHTRGLDIRIVDAPLAAAAAERQLRVALVERGRRRVFDVALSITVDGAPVELVHVPVLDKEATVLATLPPLERGVQTATVVRCVSRFPFGLFRVTRHLPVELELVTYPRPSTASAGSRAACHGVDGNATAGRSLEVAGLRPYRVGDSSADVHWKATAKRGDPIIKEREPGSREAVEVVLDRRIAGEGDNDRFEEALSQATAQVLGAAALERPLQVRSQDYSAEIDAGRGVEPVLRWLAGVTPLPAEAPPPRRLREAVHV